MIRLAENAGADPSEIRRIVERRSYQSILNTVNLFLRKARKPFS